MAFKNTLIKCLIWLGFLFVNSAITTGLVYAGVRLGAIPTVLLFAVASYAARSCCLLGYHLQCVQESLSAANRSILEASSYFRTADERLDRYVDYIEEYAPRKYVSFVDRFSYSRTFESYQRSHPIPDPDPYPWNK